MRTPRWMLWIVLAVAVAACSVQPTRVRFDGPAGTVSVEFAGSPRRESRTESAASLPAVLYRYSDNSGDYDFWQLEHGMTDAQTLLSLYRSAVLQSYENFELVGDASVAMDDYPGIAIEFAYDFGGERRREVLRYYIVGINTYILGYSALADSYQPDAAERFFGTLQHVPPTTQ